MLHTMPSFPVCRVLQTMEISHQGRNALVGLPFHHNLTFQQLFDSCGVSLAVIEQSLYSTSHQVLQRRINNVSLTLNNVSSEFRHKVADEISYLLLLILQKLYEILQMYIEKESVPFPKHFEAVQSGGPTGLLGIPHGQVHVSLEKLVAKLTVTDDESERIEEFVYQVHRRIGRSTKNTSALEKTVLGAEMWGAYLKALAAYTHPEHAPRITSAVQEDLDEIKRLLEMKELGYVPHSYELTVVCLALVQNPSQHDPEKAIHTFGKIFTLAATAQEKFTRYSILVPN
jgi:hypothetical protein